MAKFFFNPETLQYQKYEISAKRKWLNFLKFFGLMLLFSISVFYVLEDVIQSPKLKRLMADNKQLAYEIKQINNQVVQYADQLSRIEYNDDHLYRVYFEVDPIPSTKRDAGTGGALRYKSLQNKPYSDLLIETTSNLDQISRKLVIQSKSFDEVIDLARNKEAYMAAKPAIQPISINKLTRFGSAFGMRMHPILHQMRMHDGIDLTAPVGTKIYASADGTVIQAGYTTGGYGNKIMVDHGFGYKTLYGHCSKILVERGQKVQRGEVIGLVGNTGLSKGAHLHYEVWVNNRPVDPINYYANDLEGAEFEKMINLLSNADPSFDIN